MYDTFEVEVVWEEWVEPFITQIEYGRLVDYESFYSWFRIFAPCEGVPLVTYYYWLWVTSDQIII